MTRTISLISAIAATALLAVPVAWSQGVPDAFERAASASSGGATADVFERAFAARSISALPDAFERVATAARGSNAPSSDAVLRAVQNRPRTATDAVVGDHHERIPVKMATPVVPPAASSSDRDLAWLQIAIGFAFGLALAVGLVLTMRAARTRELAH
jgi:hypothetical protein